MTEQELRAALKRSLSDELPPDVRRTVLMRIKKKERPVMKSKLSVSIILTIVLMMTSLTIAAAVGNGVLEYIFVKESSPTSEQQALVQPVTAEHTSNGVTTKIVEAIWDNHRLDMAFQFQCNQPVWVQLLAVTVNDQEAAPMTTNVLNQWLVSPFDHQRTGAHGGLTCLLDQAVSGKGTVQVHLALLIPGGEVVRADESEKDTLIAQGKVAVTTAEYDRDYILISSLAATEQQATTMLDLYTRYANMKVLDDFVLTFTLEPTDTAVQASMVNVDDMPKDFRVQVEHAAVSAMGVNLSLRIYPKEGGWSQAQIEENIMFLSFYDEERQPLKFQDSNLFEMGSGPSYDEQGAWYFGIDCQLPAVEDRPAMLYVLPYKPTLDGEQLLDWTNAIPLFLSNPDEVNG